MHSKDVRPLDAHVAQVTHRPVARTEGLLTETVNGETVVLDTTSGEVHCLGALAAAVYAACDGSTQVDGIALQAAAGLNDAVTADQVADALAQLDERGLLVALPSSAGLSRRSFMRKTAAATAAVGATPLITSIVTPAFAAGTFVDERCPGGLCSADGRGDDYCACISNCPCPPPPNQNTGTCDPGKTSTCQSFGLTPPYLDSCECLRCPTPKVANPDTNNPNDYDLFDFSGTVPSKPSQTMFAFSKTVCPATWFTSATRPSCGSSGLTNGGCESGKFTNGVCLRMDPQGDTTEPCPT